MTSIPILVALLAISAPSPKGAPAADDPPPEPTAEQVDAAKDAYSKFGGEYIRLEEDHPMLVYHYFRIRNATAADLKGLPLLPFGFALGLGGKIPAKDPALKELKDLQNLIYLDLSQSEVTDAGLKELKDLKNLVRLDLSFNKKVTGATLKDVKRLTALNLSLTDVSDEGLKGLEDLKNLASLNLSDTKVTEASLKRIKSLKKLAYLNLVNTKLTDNGLNELLDLKNLTELVIHTNFVTAQGVRKMREALPKCKIIADASASEPHPNG